MSKRDQNEGLTAEELKKKMYQNLQSAGVLNNLKGYLRQSVINELRGRYKKTDNAGNDSESDLLAATMRRNDFSAEGSWNQKAIDNLVLYHLKQSRYLYSLSLFQQESGINQYDEALTEELLLRLGASPDILQMKSNKENRHSFPSPHSSSTPVANGDDPKLLMWKLLSRISSVQNLATKIDESSLRETQQQRTKPMSLADKLQAIDDEMDGTLRERRHNDIEHRKSIATLASATRRAEEAAEKRARESFEQWKKVELASMRVKEHENAKEQIAGKTHQLETDFAQRKEALLAREKNAIERLNNQKDSLEKDLHHQRQLLLQELEQIHVREKNLQEREQMMRDTEAVKLRELDLMKSEVLSHQGQTASVQARGSTSAERVRRDSAVSSCAESLRKSLTGKESRQLDEVLREFDSRSHEAEMLRRELMNLKEELTDTKAQLKQMSHSEPRPSPRQRDISPRDAGDQSLRKRLDDLTKQLNNWKEQDRAEKEATIQNEISRWRTEITKLSDARTRLDEKQNQLDDLTTRVTARLSGSSRTPRGDLKSTSHPLSTSLRILMDPQNDITRDPSIRDYDPVKTGRVRWADEMPYSIRPDLTSARSPRGSRHPAHNASGNSTLDLDSSGGTTSSNDLSTSGLRRDIRDKFKDLEKESDDLQQMYKRYIQSNYKHISPDIPTTHSPRPSPRYRANSPPKEKSRPQCRTKLPTEKTKTPTKIKLFQSDVKVKTQDRPVLHPLTSKPNPQPQRLSPIDAEKPTSSHRKEPSSQEEDSLDGTQEGPLDLKSLEKNGRSSPVNDDKSSTRLTLTESDVSESPIKEVGSGPKKDDMAPSSGEKKADSSPETSISEHSEPMKPPLQMALKPTPTKRQTSLPPISKSPKTLPPISSPTQKPAVTSVSELLIGEETPLGPPEKTPIGVDDLFGEPPQKLGEGSDSSFSSEFSLPMKKSSGQEQEREKSPFDRPAFLEQKREELQRSFDQAEPEPMKHDSLSPMHDESPNHDSKLKLDLHDDDGIQNILHSIDMGSARSIEAETDPKLVDLLNQLEPEPIHTSQKEQKPIVMSLDQENDDSHSEDSLSEKSEGGKRRVDMGSPGKKEPPKEDTYSDEEFLSSTSSKTASEVKTMSDFEPSSTSIPRIEDKLTGFQQSDEDKSGADVNWSNLQLDKSGDLPRFELNQTSPRIEETRENVDVNVFEDSQSGHSFEAPSDGGKKSHSSEDDFW